MTIEEKFKLVLLALKAVLPYLSTSTDHLTSDLVYRSPAAELREQADRIEQKDKAIKQARDAIEAVESRDIVTMCCDGKCLQCWNSWKDHDEGEEKKE